MKARNGTLRPPDEMVFGHGGDFIESGRNTLRSLKASGLKPQHSVLDIGCGIGRVAVALTEYLDEQGRYAGFDVSEKGIRWCAENITPRHPNFTFQLADIYSKAYRPFGQVPAAEYSFPYDDRSFDFALAMSLFTHMLPDGTERFLSETARVLKPGGGFIATFFLMDDQVAEPRCEPLHNRGDHWVAHPEFPEALVVHAKDSISERYERSGFLAHVRERGDWWKRERAAFGTQDCILGQRRASKESARRAAQTV